MTDVLMLHRVLEDVPTAFGVPSCYHLRGTALTPDDLESLLSIRGPFVDLRTVVDAIATGRPPPNGSVLTFDDGYADLRAAASLLRSRGVRATHFVTTGCTGAGTRLLPVDGVYWLLDNARRPDVTLHGPEGTRIAGRLDPGSRDRERSFSVFRRPRARRREVSNVRLPSPAAVRRGRRRGGTTRRASRAPVERSGRIREIAYESACPFVSPETETTRF